MSELKTFKPKFPDVAEFPLCNNGEIDWYVRMPISQLLAEPNIGKLLEIHEEEGMIQEI